MSLTIKVENDPVIATRKVAAVMLSELTDFAKGPVGGSLLHPVLDQGGDAYTLSIASGKKTATSGRSVTLDLKEMKVDVAKTADDLKEAVESAIFELTNASRLPVFADLEAQLLAGTKQIHAYGRDQAGIEAEASWNVYRTISERPNYVPSRFGQNTVTACKKYSSLDQFRAFFLAEPHDRAAQGSAASLPSAEFYAFNAAYTVGGRVKETENVFQKQFESLKVGSKTLDLNKLKGQAPDSASINSMNIKAPTFYWVAIEFIKAQGDIAPKPRGGSWTDYEFTSAMKAIAGDTGGAMRAAFDKAWSTKKSTLLVD